MFRRIVSCTGVLVAFMVFFGTGGAMAQEIPIKTAVSLDVGQSTVIHGERGKCGQNAPDWETVATSLPTLSTGKFSDGGLGTRYSRQCGGATPGRAIRFTATTPGTEQIQLYGDTIRIEVR